MEENIRLCRICISDSSTSVMMSIFGEDGLWKKIQKFANVQIAEGDNLPQQICMMCARNTLNACSFKRKCEESDSFFRNQLALKIPKIKDIITISSGETSEEEDDVSNNNQQELEKNKNHTLKPTTNGSNNYDHWISNNNQINDDDQLALIPEIELITPNEDEKIEEGQIQGYQCSICFQIFAMRAILNHHVKTSHPESTSSYECFNCKKEYLSKRFLEKHVRRGRCVKKRKNQTRPMQCSDCHTLFPSGHHLGWHKRTGCPSKLSLQQLKQLNLTNKQSNLIYRENVLRKVNTVFHKHHQKKFGRPKQKGRSRIKLDASKIDYARQLIGQDVTTSKLAQELKISRTFAWRLRKSLLNGVSLHERIASPHHTPNFLENKNANDQILIPNDVNSHNNNSIPVPLLVQKIYENDNNTNKNEDNVMQKDNYNENKKVDEIEMSENDASEYELVVDETMNDPQPSCSSTSPNGNDQMKFKLFRTVNDTYQLKKPRKQNVFLDQNKYERAKILVGNNVSTMEIARQLNVSQMSAWKLRDAIVKNMPLTFRKPLTTKSMLQGQQDIQQQEQHHIISEHKGKYPRTRLKAAERHQRDQKVTEAILAMIKEDNNIQYWKITERLAKKGFTISPSSVCQKLKSLGIHRRWKTGKITNDNNKIELPLNAFKLSNATTSTYPSDESGTGDGGGYDNFDNYEQNILLSGAHFLRSTFSD